MMNSINVGLMPQAPAQLGTAPLTPDQLSGLTKILENYDPKNVSQSDAEEIVSGVKTLGIEPGRGLASAMADSGFDARQIGDKAGAGKDRPPPPPPGGGGPKGPDGQSGTINKEAINALKLLIENYEGQDITDDDWTDILTAMDEQGYGLSQTLLDVKL